MCASNRSLIHAIHLPLMSGPDGYHTNPPTVFRMNRFDEFALEEALLIKEHYVRTVVHALSVGPERVGSTIRRALEMGADHGIHILDPSDGYISPFSVASLIAAYARDKGYDLIIDRRHGRG